MNRGAAMAGPGNLKLRVSGTVGELIGRASKGLTLITSLGDIGRPRWKVFVLTAVEQFCPAGQLKLPVMVLGVHCTQPGPWYHVTSPGDQVEKPPGTQHHPMPDG